MLLALVVVGPAYRQRKEEGYQNDDNENQEVQLIFLPKHI